MNVIKLPTIEIQGEPYYVDKRLKQFRNVQNPHDTVPFDEAFVRVRFTTEHVVLNDPDCIRKARKDLRLAIRDAYEFEEIEDHIDTEPASPELVESILPELLKELEDENEST